MPNMLHAYSQSVGALPWAWLVLVLSAVAPAGVPAHAHVTGQSALGAAPAAGGEPRCRVCARSQAFPWPPRVERVVIGRRYIEGLRLRGGAPGRATPARTPVKGPRTPARQSARQAAKGATPGSSRAQERGAHPDNPGGKKRRLSRDSAAQGGPEPAKAAQQAEEAASALKVRSVESKRPRHEMVSGEYFAKSLRTGQVDQVSADRGSELAVDEFRPGAADASDESATSEAKQEESPMVQDQAQERMEHANRSAFVPVIYDEAVDRPPVRERDEWLELLRKMDNYSKVI